ncbi:dnaJ homolog subfamily C member 13-like [Oppia nitens]|uniref:dnaJ homolog subfamily C member 13-like n=1 Tax=Oppia nitens TaxID=1686743 RepID=UPI0023DCC91B|nr:dnaJ homolog subfamily C member 13-like [Oppia nitens]
MNSSDKMTLKDNSEITSFFVTKHSWKGKYKRVLTIGSSGISTHNISSMECTNSWPYQEVVNVTPIIPKTQLSPSGAGPTLVTGGNELFQLTFKKGRKVDSMKFSSEYRSDIITAALHYRHKFSDPNYPITGSNNEPMKYSCYKHHWSDRKIPVFLEIGVSGINQLDAIKQTIITSYHYKDIDNLIIVSDLLGGFVISYGGFNRYHLFNCDQRDDLLKRICESAWNNVGVVVRIKKETITSEHFQSNRFGRYSDDDSVTSLFEFNVHKISARHNSEPIKRILCLTDTCLVERDPNSYLIATLRPLSDVFALIRHTNNQQMFSIEYIRGEIRSYTSTDRDAFLASIMDGVRASGNIDVHVKMSHSQRAHRMAPYYARVDEEVESQHLKFLQTPPNNWTFNDAIRRFNANCAYSGLEHSVTQDGLFAENKEKMIFSSLASFADRDGDHIETSDEHLEQHFQALRRLVASKAGFSSFTANPRFRESLGLKVVRSLKRNNDNVIHSAIDMLCALMQPMHDDYDLRQEQLNKSSLLSSKAFLESLLDVLKLHVDRGTGALVVSSMLDFLTFSLCAPYSETTDGGHFDTLLEMVATYGRPIFRLFQHPSLAIVKGAGLVMKAIIEEGTPDISSKMQELALAEGALLRHIHIALFSFSSDGRFLPVQHLSRQLVSLWTTDNGIASTLLKRIIPIGLLNYLDSDEKPPKEAIHSLLVRDNLKLAQNHSLKNTSRLDIIRDIHPSVRVIERHLDNVFQHWRQRIGIQKKDDPKLMQRPVVLRKRRERVKSTDNWNLLYYQFWRDHSKPDLIWNFKTREELRDALVNEMRIFLSDKELCGNQIISWNHTEFEVQYQSLNEEIKIGFYYLRLLLEEDTAGESNLTDRLLIKDPKEFFNDLYHRFLLNSKSPMKASCLQAMSIVYSVYHEDIGAFNDTKFIVSMLERTSDKTERDRLIIFISKLIVNKHNAKEFIDSGGVRVLVDLITLAHLHVNRATVPTQTNVIEASPEIMAMGSSEKEWYIGDAEKERKGPFSFAEIKEFWSKNTLSPKTKCWAQGLESWKPLIHVPQLKWTLIASNNPLLNESELSVLILNILIKISELYPNRDSDNAIIRPLPKVKRILSDSLVLPHIVQLLLTFDPTIVERVATLLALVMQDNPGLPRLYQTGLFYFILMYTGSNLLPIGRLLSISHGNQAFRSEDNSNLSILQRSVLGQLLPEAMICYLENYGPEKFAQTFLGEFDTPEAIWSTEMRRLMIEKIASHIADFSPRLRSNTRALYQYCPIPPIQYPQLEFELFGNIYYLKNLCDINRFPDWEIKDPVQFLRDLLELWKVEIEKKPNSMSIEDAYNVLGLGRDFSEGRELDENKVRKAYFKFAQQFHPDKNPEGRDRFEEVNKAYEFLCSKNVRNKCNGPDPQNITLILRAQSILFNRYSEPLHPYKYSGYPMLIKTLQLETDDDQLFSKPYPLLPSACETAFYTVKCSALNAEELRREGGLEILCKAFNRCVSVLSASSKVTDVSVEVCTHIVRCFTVSASFTACRHKISEMTSISRDICRVLYFKHLPKLCIVAVECVAAFAADPNLQLQLFKSGALFSLLLFLFKYDYTLEEGGVESSEESNQQQVANQLAKSSLIAVARIAQNLSSKSDTLDSQFYPLIRQSTIALLTPYLAKQLETTSTSDILKTLNSNIENPYLIWDNSTRAELTDYLETQQRENMRSGECPDTTYGSTFEFSSHKEELIVGDIFVRIYNDQPMFPLETPKRFTIDLLDYLGSQAQYLQSALNLVSTSTGSLNTNRLNNIKVCLNALNCVIIHNNGVEMQCIGHFKLLFSLLRLDQMSDLQTLAVNVIASVSGNKDCVQDIASSEVLVYLLMVLHPTKQTDDYTKQLVVLTALTPLMFNTKLIKEALTKGAILYLLTLYAKSNNFEVREKAAELLSKMTSDKLNGPRIKLILHKFVPSLFIDAMKDSPQTAVHLFDGTQENPELIWNESARRCVCDTLIKMCEELYTEQMNNPSSVWKLDNDFEIKLPVGFGEFVIAGVYLRLYVQNPSWVVRKPKEFLTELLDTAKLLMEKEEATQVEKLELVTNALTCLLQTQSALLDSVPAMGHIQAFVNNLSNRRHESIPKSCLQILRQMSENKTCIESMISCKYLLTQIYFVIKTYETLTCISCETLSKLFEIDSIDELVSQAIKIELIHYLLKLLDTKQSQHNSSTKAQIVQILKSMLKSNAFGQQVNDLLDKSVVWSEYRDQKHDLFITNTQISGYLTGSTVQTAGYLTQGTSVNSMPSSPPPL